MTAAARKFLLQRDIFIVNSGATHLYITPTARHCSLKTSAPKISVGTATRHVEGSSATATLPIPQLAAYFPTTGYIMTSFTNTLVGAGPTCDADCTVLFGKHDVTVFSFGGKPTLTGWREKEIPKLCRHALIPNKELLLHQNTEIKKKRSAYSAYDLPIVEALVRYTHAESGFPVKSTCIREIKRGNFETWQGLTYSNTSKYCPREVETMKGHMVQSYQGVHSLSKQVPQKLV